MASALHTVQKLFPSVTTVTDAKKNCTIEVTKRDTTSATVRNHKACAMAVACKRKFEADGVIVSVDTAYVIKGDKATRYKVPQSVAREVVSFDRNAGFSEGEYQLKRPAETQKIGRGSRGPWPDKSGGRNGNLAKRFRHQTENIRTSLGSKHTA